MHSTIYLMSQNISLDFIFFFSDQEFNFAVQEKCWKTKNVFTNNNLVFRSLLPTWQDFSFTLVYRAFYRKLVFYFQNLCGMNGGFSIITAGKKEWLGNKSWLKSFLEFMRMFMRNENLMLIGQNLTLIVRIWPQQVSNVTSSISEILKYSSSNVYKSKLEKENPLCTKISVYINISNIGKKSGVNGKDEIHVDMSRH